MEDTRIFEDIHAFGVKDRFALVLEDKDQYPMVIWLTWKKAEKLIGDLIQEDKRHKERYNV